MKLFEITGRRPMILTPSCPYDPFITGRRHRDRDLAARNILLASGMSCKVAGTSGMMCMVAGTVYRPRHRKKRPVDASGSASSTARPATSETRQPHVFPETPPPYGTAQFSADFEVETEEQRRASRSSLVNVKEGLYAIRPALCPSARQPQSSQATRADAARLLECRNYKLSILYELYTTVSRLTHGSCACEFTIII